MTANITAIRYAHTEKKHQYLSYLTHVHLDLLKIAAAADIVVWSVICRLAACIEKQFPN